MSDVSSLPAGDFADWLRDIRTALGGHGVSDVECGACTACCRSSLFVHIRPHETDALAHIPTGVVFPAPMRAGEMVMGYDEHGRCPMLTESGCSVYSARPQTCRVFDCRVFSAAGIAAEQPLIARQADRWVFDYAFAEDRAKHEAVRAAARFLMEHPESVAGGRSAVSQLEIALTAIKVCELFDGSRSHPTSTGGHPDDVSVEAIIDECRRFDSAARDGTDSQKTG